MLIVISLAKLTSATPSYSLFVRFSKLSCKKFRMQMNSDQSTSLNKDTLSSYIQQEQRKLKLQIVPLISQSHKLNDLISQWILTLSFSRSQDLQRFLINQEVRLFRHRLNRLKIIKLSEYVKILRSFADQRFPKLNPDIIKNKEKFITFQKDVAKAKHISNHELIPQSVYQGFYSIPFTQTSLYEDRTVQLIFGQAIVPLYKMESMLINQFKEKLQKRIFIAHKYFPVIVAQDCRMKQLLLKMNDQYSGPDYSQHQSKGLSGQKINLGDLNHLANSSSYPPCMKVLHQNLLSSHHLKHYGRLQYGLFLKGAGLSMKESVDFWKRQFCKKIPIQKFEKEYLYNIRHSYGQEGKRADYTPWNCTKVIKTNAPMANQYHGCPFKNYDSGHLIKILDSYGITAEQMNNILKYKTGKQYQRACMHLFMASHPNSPPENVGNHPNAFLSASLSSQKANKN